VWYAYDQAVTATNWFTAQANLVCMVPSGKLQPGPLPLGPISRCGSGNSSNMLRSFSRDSITRMCSNLPKLNLSTSNSTGHPLGTTGGLPPAWPGTTAAATGGGSPGSNWYAAAAAGAATGHGGPSYSVEGLGGFSLVAAEGFGQSPGTRQLCGTCRERAQGSASHLCDPEHLIVNGSGGAFMHPTHVFSYSRFASLKDEAAEATAAMYSSTKPCCTR
jgi:hypothetical protein